jgi:hypothetical protein
MRESIMADAYLQQILAREEVGTGYNSPAKIAQMELTPIVRDWAGGFLLDITPSGSFAKGTANRSGTDVDLFISISESCTNTLKEIYELLFKRMQEKGLSPKRQNVSINVKVKGIDVDLVPGKRQNAFNYDHSLYRHRADAWTKTNVVTHINYVRNAGRQSETRILKLWRNQKGLDFPSFYLELTTIAALAGRSGTLSQNVLSTLQYICHSLAGTRVVDPANTNNIVSDDLSAAERGRIKAAAESALGAQYWKEIVL